MKINKLICAAIVSVVFVGASVAAFPKPTTSINIFHDDGQVQNVNISERLISDSVILSRKMNQHFSSSLFEPGLLDRMMERYRSQTIYTNRESTYSGRVIEDTHEEILDTFNTSDDAISSTTNVSDGNHEFDSKSHKNAPPSFEPSAKPINIHKIKYFDGDSLARLLEIPNAKVFFFEVKPGLGLDKAIQFKGISLQQSGDMWLHYIPNDPSFSSVGSLGFPLLEDLWGLHLVGMEQAWDFGFGAGIIIAMVDSGIRDTHEDLFGNIWTNLAELNGVAGVDDDNNGYVDDFNGWDFVFNDNNPNDADGHGSHTSGTAAAARDNSLGIVGIAPDAAIMPLRTCSGSCPNLAIAEGIRYAADMGADIINMSLGGSFDSDIANAVTYAQNLGVIVVASAGNDFGSADDNYPAALPNVITVGALRHEYDTVNGSGPLSRAAFSSVGNVLDIMAPGVDILSAWNESDDDYNSIRGTSMAAPMISGVVALLLAQDPTMGIDDIYRRLTFSATDMGDPGFDTSYGYGMVNPFKALSEDYYSDGIQKKSYLPAPDQYGLIEYTFSPTGFTIAASDGITHVVLVELYDVTMNVSLFLYLDDEDNTLKTQHLLDEDFFGFGRGRLARQRIADGSYTDYDDYYDAYNVSLHQRDYDAANNLLATRMYEVNGDLIPSSAVLKYYSSGILKSYSNPDTGILNEYFDENFYGNDIGRVSKKVFQDEIAFNYSYHTGTDTVSSRQGFIGGSLFVTEAYDSNGVLTMKDFVSGNQQWFYESGNMQKANVISTGGSGQAFVETVGGVTYEYLDEDYYGDGTGRYSKVTYSDGSYDVYEEYHGNTNKPKIIKRYDAGDNLVATFTYHENGALISALLSSFSTDGIGNATTGISNLSVSSNGDLVWTASDGNDNEVYLYDGISIQNLSNNNVDDRDPTINSSGQVAWSGFVVSSPASNYSLYFYNGITSDRVFFTGSREAQSPIMIDDGRVVYETVEGTLHRLWLFNGSNSQTTLQTTTSDIDSYVVNSSGQVAWRNVVSSSDQDIYFNDGDGSATVVLRNDSKRNFAPKIADNGFVTWEHEFSTITDDHDIYRYRRSL